MPDRHLHGRVLIIDDTEQTRYVFRRILTRAGYTVDEAATAGAGLSKAAALPDIIVVDVNLPDMLGYDLSRRLKSDPATAGIPVLQISASFVSDESKIQALQGGADAYLVQPVEPPVLLAQIQALMRLKNAEAASSSSARQWQTTFDALTDGLALIDPEGEIVRVNRSFLKMLDLTHSQTQHLQVADLFHSLFDLSLSEALGEATGHTPEITFRGRWFKARRDLIQGHPVENQGSILLLTDITVQKKLQETLKMSERLAATGRLAHIIAHEINNPLEAMSNLLYLAQQDPSVQAATRSYLDQAGLELRRISQITKQVLAYHRDSKTPIDVDAHEIVESVVAMFRAHLSVIGIELVTDIRCVGSVPMHPGEIRQAFGNIIANAVDVMSQGGRLIVRCIPSVDYRTRTPGVRFLFSDNGPGIPEHTREHIFDAFFTTKDVRGSGIGLWLASETIGKHHGRIRIRSRTHGPFRGTLFDVFLPQHKASAPHPSSGQRLDDPEAFDQAAPS